MKNTVLAVLIVAAGFMVAQPAFAHHAQSVYDESKNAVLKGTVTEYLLINPHMQVHFQVKDASGNVVGWVAQGGSVNSARRRGWTRTTIKPGDQVTVTGHLARNGQREMHIVKMEVNGKLIREVTPDGPREIPLPGSGQGGNR